MLRGGVRGLALLLAASCGQQASWPGERGHLAGVFSINVCPAASTGSVGCAPPGLYVISNDPSGCGLPAPEASLDGVPLELVIPGGPSSYSPCMVNLLRGQRCSGDLFERIDECLPYVWSWPEVHEGGGRFEIGGGEVPLVATFPELFKPRGVSFEPASDGRVGNGEAVTLRWSPGKDVCAPPRAELYLEAKVAGSAAGELLGRYLGEWSAPAQARFFVEVDPTRPAWPIEASLVVRASCRTPASGCIGALSCSAAVIDWVAEIPLTVTR